MYMHVVETVQSFWVIERANSANSRHF